MVSVAGEQLDALGLAPGEDAEAIVFDLVNPAGSRRRLLGRAREARFDGEVAAQHRSGEKSRLGLQPLADDASALLAVDRPSFGKDVPARRFPPPWTVDPLLAHILTEDLEVHGWGTFRVGGAWRCRPPRRVQHIWHLSRHIGA